MATQPGSFASGEGCAFLRCVSVMDGRVRG